MKKKILIVEDQFIEANNLQMILEKAGYKVCTIARSVSVALEIIEKEKPNLVLLDIFLQGNLTGIDLAKKLPAMDIGFVYLSANSNRKTLDEAKVTRPYGFLVKPFREKDILVTLDIAWYLHEQYLQGKKTRENHSPSASVPAEVPEFRQIIGRSKALQEILGSVLMVAPSDTSVLLLGESGTGKEKIAESIHQLSARKNNPFIKVNCAALPVNLIESELFGHEKGSFTGAYERRIGKFEQANSGTIFLDEIGELPIELQVKLLRVLQEKEIERVGGRETIKTDVRIVTATNRDLEKEISEGRFRMDLYYRLNVFPITLPPLRDRREDIPLLAAYFVQHFARKINKPVKDISADSMKKLLEHHWPGNIRELENLVERSVLLASGPTITDIILPHPVQSVSWQASSEPTKTIEENERDHIIAVLKRCKGKIAGHGGAADILKINVSTLNSRIKRLGIQKENYFTVEK